MKDTVTINYAGCLIEIEGTYYEGEFSSFNMTGATLLKGDLLDLIETARSMGIQESIDRVNKRCTTSILTDMETLACEQLDKQMAA